VRRKKFFRIPILDLSGNAHTELAHVEILDLRDAGFLSENPFPKTVDPFPDASNRANTGDDNASAAHAFTGFV
jgi:hypothetical protein